MVPGGRTYGRRYRKKLRDFGLSVGTARTLGAADGPADQADGRAGAEPARGQRARRRPQQQRQVHGGQPLQTGRPQGRRNRPHGRIQRREVHQYLISHTHSLSHSHVLYFDAFLFTIIYARELLFFSNLKKKILYDF